MIRVALAALALSLLLRLLGASSAAGLAMLVFVCLGPGLLPARLLDRSGSRGFVSRLIAALALSPVLLTAVSALLYLGLGLSLASAAWAAVAVLALGLVGVQLGLRVSDWAVGRWDWSLLWPAVGMLLITLGVFLLHGNRLAYHGILHAGIVAQIHAGLIPPENPALAGAPLEFYWMYHWLLAVWTELDGFSILVNAPVIEVSSLVVYIGAGNLLARRVFGARRAAWVAVALGFAGNLLFPIFFVAKLWLSGAPEAPYWPMDLIQVGWIGGDPRVVTLYAKFLALGGFPLGLAMWALLLEELVPSEQRAPRPALVFLGLVGVILFHPPTALAAYLALSLAYASRGIDAFAGLRPAALWRHNRDMAGVFVAALIVTSPYLAATTSGVQSSSIALATASRLLSYNAQGILLGATPLLLALVWAVMRGGRDRQPRFLMVATASLLLAGLLLRLPDNNQYKFILIAFLPGGALLFHAIAGIVSGRNRRAWLFATGLLTLLSVGITAAGHFEAASSRRRDPRGDIGYLANPGDPELNDALLWLRERSPFDAVVISRPIRFGGSMITAISGRGVFLLDGGHHTLGQPLAASRVGLVTQIFSPEIPVAPALRRARAQLGRPLYLLLREQEFPDEFRALARRFDAESELLKRVWSRPDVVLYAVRANPIGGVEATAAGREAQPQ